MRIPELHLGHTKYPEGQGIIVKNAVYKNEKQLERSFPHRHSFYVICLIRSGSGIHVIDFEEFEVRPNRLFIVSPLQVHFWKLNTNTNISLVQFSERILNFNNESVSSLLSILIMNRNYLDLSSDQSNEVLSIAKKLEQETVETDNFSADIILGYLIVLCRLIERMAEIKDVHNQIKSKGNKMQLFLELVEKNFTRNKGVSYCADELYITPNYLNMLSKKHFGKSASEMIASRIMLEAKKLLYHTTSDISQIAFELGYEDPSYFTRSFRRFERKTPSEFREEIYKKYQHRNNKY
jgi:AraC-like DNA-binding protein/mannose-6-phosphate isomerase-like protein (cupin superfamily)